MTVHSTLGTILFIAAMLLGLRILVSWLIETPRWQRRFYPRWANACCIPRRAMTRRQLVELAANRQPLQIVRTTLALWLLFGATACYGRFAWLKAGAAMLTILILMLFFALSSLRDGILPMAELYRHRDFDRHFASRSFRYVDGAWQYADEDWFIRVGGSVSCALYAPALDFSAPVRCAALATCEGGGRIVRPVFLPALHFQRKDGRTQPAVGAAQPDFVDWIARHGGKISL